MDARLGWSPFETVEEAEGRNGDKLCLKHGEASRDDCCRKDTPDLLVPSYIVVGRVPVIKGSLPTGIPGIPGSLVLLAEFFVSVQSQSSRGEVLVTLSIIFRDSSRTNHTNSIQQERERNGELMPIIWNYPNDGALQSTGQVSAPAKGPGHHQPPAQL